MLATALPTRLHAADLILIAAYLVGITLFGLRFRGKDKGPRSLRNYFLADQAIPWWAIMLSIVSAETSTLTIISIPGLAFASDFGFLQLVIGYIIGRTIVAFLFLPKYFKGQMYTAYQLIDNRFGPALHKVTAGLFLATRAAAEGVRVFAVSIVVAIAIGTGDVISIILISALTLLYTFEGGMAAVIWTDVVQMIIYFGGTLVAILTLSSHVPGGWHTIHTVAGAAGRFHLFHFAMNLTETYTFWAGILGGTFLTMASHGTDQLMVQRMLAARNLRQSQIALISSGLVIFVQFAIFLLIGAGLFVFYGLHPETFASADRIFPTFIVQEMPVGIAGLLIAAILAAAMSNLSAAYNSLSSTTVVDFYMHLRPKADERERMLISRSSTVIWALVLCAIAVYCFYAGGKGHVVEIGLSIASVAYGALLGVFLLGTLARWATQTGAIIGMVIGFTLNVWLWQGDFPAHFGPITIPHIAYTWYVLIGAIVTFAIGSLASLIFRSKSRAKSIATTTAILLCLSVFPFRSAAQEPASSHAHPETSNTVILSAAARTPGAGAPFMAQSHRAMSGVEPSPDFSQITTLMNEAIAAHKLPGGVVLIDHDGHQVFEQAYGNRKVAGELSPNGSTAAEPMTEDTIFDMASLSKCLSTSVAIMQLYEEGKLQFDDPVAKYLPAFAQNGKEHVTIRELLTHYSGLPPDVNLKDPWGLAAPDKAEGIRRAMASPLANPPGTKFVYSDINFITLGALVEKLSGETLDVYAEQHIFQPLGMTDTMYHPFAKACGPRKAVGSAILYVAPKTHLDMVGDTRPFLNSPCSKGDWNAASIIPNVAPTTHDDEGNAQTNPHFDMLTRGTVHDPTTRRMGGVAGHAGVFSTAHDVSLYANALLEKLLYNKGPFPLKQSTLKLMTEPEQPSTAENTATIFTPDGRRTKGVGLRGFGWDINTAFSRPRGTIFPIGSFGHTGFTGTDLWMDPASNTAVILLANAVHPRGNPPISALRGAVATAAAKALGLQSVPPLALNKQNVFLPQQAIDPAEQRRCYCPPGAICEPAPPCPAAPADNVTRPPASCPPGTFCGPRVNESDSQNINAPTLTGIDVLETTNFAALKEAEARHDGHLRLGLLTNQSGLDSHGRRTVDILHTDAEKQVPGLELVTLFSPEHGLFGAKDSTNIPNATDPATHLPIISLYGAKPEQRHPRPESLKDLDAVIIDLQDAGVRFYTYDTVMGYFLEAAARQRALGHNLDIIVLDRPNIIGGTQVQGPVSDPGSESYINYMPLPVRTGLTIGELARYFNSERMLPNATNPNIQTPINALLTVVPMQNWRRADYFDNTRLPWTNPSPNLRTLAAATLYPGLGFLDSTDVSVGRGTAKPFEQIGASYINGTQLAAYLTARHIPGVSFAPTTFAVEENSNRYPGHGKTVSGISFTVTDRAALDSPELGIEVLSALHHLYPKFPLNKAAHLIANTDTLDALNSNEDPRAIAAAWSADLAKYEQRRQRYLLY